MVVRAPQRRRLVRGRYPGGAELLLGAGWLRLWLWTQGEYEGDDVLLGSEVAEHADDAATNDLLQECR